MHDAFGISHLIFSDHGWLWVTETVECKSKDKVGYSITSAFWTNEKKIDFRVLYNVSVLRDQEEGRQSVKKDLLHNQLVHPLHARHVTLQDAFSLVVQEGRHLRGTAVNL